MDYKRIYLQLVERAKTRSLDYYETHHITPRCMGGSDSLENLVQLTPEEHYIAHQLLVKMHPDNKKLAHAANMMCVNRTSNKLYGWVRRRLAESMKSHNPNKNGKARRKYNKMHGSPNRGYKHTDVTKQILSELKLGDNNPNKDGKARLTETTLVHAETGEVLVFASLKDAEKELKANHASVYNNRKAGKSYRGYYWYVGNEYQRAD